MYVVEQRIFLVPQETLWREFNEADRRFLFALAMAATENNLLQRRKEFRRLHEIFEDPMPEKGINNEIDLLIAQIRQCASIRIPDKNS